MPLTVGVEHMTIRRFQNVFVLLIASESGSPSVPALGGYLSTSSASTTRIGREARSPGALAPTIVICPPLNFLCNSVLPLSRDLGSATLLASAGVSRSMGANRSLLQASPSLIVGWTSMIG